MSNFETVEDWINIHTDGTCKEANDCLITLAQAIRKQEHIDKGDWFTHHEDTHCCSCPCMGLNKSVSVKQIGVKHSEEKRTYWRDAQRRHRTTPPTN